MLSPELKTNLVNKNHIDEQIPQYKKEKKKESEDQKYGGIKWKMEIQHSGRKQEQFTKEMKTNLEEVQMKRPC